MRFLLESGEQQEENGQMIRERGPLLSLSPLNTFKAWNKEGKGRGRENEDKLFTEKSSFANSMTREIKEEVGRRGPYKEPSLPTHENGQQKGERVKRSSLIVKMSKLWKEEKREKSSLVVRCRHSYITLHFIFTLHSNDDPRVTLSLSLLSVCGLCPLSSIFCPSLLALIILPHKFSVKERFPHLLPTINLEKRRELCHPFPELSFAAAPFTLCFISLPEGERFKPLVDNYFYPFIDYLFLTCEGTCVLPVQQPSLPLILL